MAKRAPGFIADGSPVGEQRARTELLAGAFNEAAGDFFEREVEYEEAIEAAAEDRDDARRQGIAGAVVGVLICVLGLVMQNTALLVGGVVVAAAVGWLKYREYQDAVGRIESNRASLEQNSPDGTVSFVSQVAVPAYLVQYGAEHMIFDGLNAAPETRLELALIDGDELISARNDFEEVTAVLEDNLSGEQVLDPDVARKISPGIEDHKRLEKPITDQIDRMTEIARDVQTESIPVNVHANDDTARSIRTMGREGLFRSNGTVPLVETSQSMAESRQVLDDIRGVEEQAVSGDMLDQARENRDAVVEATDDILARLESNVETVTDHFDRHATRVDDSTKKYVCETCLAEEIESIDGELDLADEILSAESGSFGVALSDGDLDDVPVEGDGEFTDQVRDDIEAEIPVLQEHLRRAYNTLPDLGVGGDYCATHGTVETTAVSRDGQLFGEVWRSLYYQFRDPIMDSVDDLEREAEEARQNKEQKMIDLAQYEQIKDSVERDYQSVKADYQAAKAIEETL
ncbi:hypothetical protein [Halosimplex marinum]|uniref:hypothetical protein n=1 Tax=Halosimplex marinum TaxID=3396620 RepID=UPI003F557D9A